MFNIDIVDISRLQFAATALYHFLFVPLTLGLSIILAIMESIYVITNRPIWKQMTIFWGLLFGINFALGVATGIVMEFQFGMNWSYYSHYVGDIFGAPLAIEGIMAFFLEATFIGLFFFGWDRLSKKGHLFVTWLVALGSNLSALWILIANAWMQNPTGAIFNPDTMRMEMVNFLAVLLNPVAQAKFIHTVSAGYVTASVFVVGISSWYLLKGKNIDIAKKSIIVATSFGLAASLSVVILGDESGYLMTEHQHMKLAAIESSWETEPAPAGLNLIAIPNFKERKNDFELKIPYLMGILTTRSFDKTIPGINDLIEQAKIHIKNGVNSYRALNEIRINPDNEYARKIFDNSWKDLGYALLLKKYNTDLNNVTEEEISQAAIDTIPNVLVLFYCFRIMVAIGFYLILLFAILSWKLIKNTLFKNNKFLLKMALFSLPLPWIAAECGWIIAEYGRQPWVIEGILPTYYAASDLTMLDLSISLGIFLLIYSALFIVGLKLMLKTIKNGPDYYIE
ncbi:Cytochrome bd-I ubiquinol oxidase subunit 1 [Candidatus Kinetoplastibacterium sorsogonicusi]|uniref:Cytochrome bd-I ubiquinol oxidase subunit 1 n=1 Tax=Candidatus Kinetoplastidibacterium kentomonadis TaxID=1576550 RepID=A0A3Q8EUM9_9PROT|nr:cytochrome ubiquinol oxidase subunit I [Candidatus Kinetoplastibacterium sorsogonicusi]AWD32725.1 Cytochrome bd-I ubiquinol oxidase subunit 1 [Candidatus Kinetoplastibacterium sorsogonicusi]